MYHTGHRAIIKLYHMYSLVKVVPEFMLYIS
jgi:hypothetical protein